MKNPSGCGKDGPLEGRRKQAYMLLSYYKNEDWYLKPVPEAWLVSQEPGFVMYLEVENEYC